MISDQIHIDTFYHISFKRLVDYAELKWYADFPNKT